MVISAATKKQLLKYLRCDPEKIHVIHWNVSEEFQALPKSFNATRPRLLQVGTMENKNIERVAEAIRGLEYDLIVIGPLSDSQRAALVRNAVSFENRVGLSQEDLLNEYRLCDVLVFASTYEGFGLPIVEANAVGRPVVTSNLLSMPEVSGKAACLVDPFDVGSIRTGIRRVIEESDYREQLVSLGFTNAERYRVEVIASQYAELYREIHYQANHHS